MVATHRPIDRLDPVVDMEASILSGLHDALAWRQTSEFAMEKRTIPRTVIYPVAAGLKPVLDPGNWRMDPREERWQFDQEIFSDIMPGDDNCLRALIAEDEHW
jgi:hypothetical protein